MERPCVDYAECYGVNVFIVNPSRIYCTVKPKFPSVGDKIIHREPYFDREHTGKVTQILSSQFVYETCDGQERLCLFSEDWSQRV